MKVKFKIDKRGLALFDGCSQRQLTIPSNRKKQVGYSIYFPEKNTQLKYHIKYLRMDGDWHQTQDIVAKRIWGALWEEGWRER